ncbi:pyruvate:ferredoxin (flavodoxin) oxidoreductase [Halarcobacter anaerophilus]|uniref:Pyruvate:ferredoxin (Flavodoxin) oxidoreductase n=1 Tax=Halarcobacter anaerophilus TaxID=877500 RepID=A0A4Q0Y201_9BACT|nr:pyruvate:ferredoxin (flavodoxin) oxidoreductase [Halarcobacter anaerophilus]QDF27778.1 pyruvate:ferredoxin (flavodoxin) oxidoreductase, homodimeric [Halarcobacter anaerophilus]RXJ64120.1 pyruvate:ferredoxin (flavodoxin) oxidoreductase [Halarcobacter anaerophilus]
MSKKFATMDGNEAASYVSYAFTEVAGVYPITPSSQMGDNVEKWATQGKKNLFGSTVKVIEMQSEAGAAGTFHGSLQAGALTTTFTASQGLLLKIPNMYKVAGQLLPGVIHVAARSLATHALSIFGDHQDVMSTRATGFAMMSTSSVQEVMDLGGVAHLSAIKGRVPFLHFFDGFRTSHEINKVEVMPYEVFDRLIDYDAVQRFRDTSLNPESPVTRGTAQNDDIYFQGREAANKYYEALPDIVNNYMKEISKVTGRDYAPFTFYGDPEATDIIVAMGSVNETIRETVDFLRKTEGRKVGLLIVHLFRPFSTKYFMDALPDSVERICVIDRTKEAGSLGEPLFLDVKAVFYEQEKKPLIIGGRYGLSSKDVPPNQIIALFDNLASQNPKNHFTVGINDDVTFTSIDVKESISVVEDVSECLFYGLGADGTVGANKNSVKIIGDKTDLYAQAYFAYDSKKSGGYTRSHLRFSKNPIRSTYLVNSPKFIACSKEIYLEQYEVIDRIKQGGTFLLNSIYSVEEIANKIPDRVKKIIADKEVKFYIINATKIARDIGLGTRTNTIMQAAFFKLADIIPYEEAKTYMKEYAEKAYGNKGEEIVKMNYLAIDSGEEGLVEVPVDSAWSNLEGGELVVKSQYHGSEYVEKFAKVVNAAKGDELPVSSIVNLGMECGTFENGSTKYEKRAIATMVPQWNEDTCIQCNQCAFECPHAVIRPFLMDEEEFGSAPEGVKTHSLDAKAKGTKDQGLKYKIQVSIMDCTGCNVCVDICPTKEKSLKMVPYEVEDENKEQENADYLFNDVTYKDYLVKKDTVQGSQFAQPLFEFHSACPGCGETPYITLATQLFGDRMMVSNATGCSSIYSASAPSTPFTKNAKGEGPAWANSLFEDAAEFGYGMHAANETIRNRMGNIMQETMEKVTNPLKGLYKEWLENRSNGVKTQEIRDKLVPQLEQNQDLPGVKELLSLKKYIVRKSQWIIGGDGWAYDIGYGGLDHVLSTGENVNMLVVDTEVYSNTGGQSSKAARTGSIADFTNDGKPNKNKDLGYISMTYGNIFVAQINSRANQKHAVQAMKEAEEYDGPSLIIAYSPCIAHGIQGGLMKSVEQGKLATDCGYWPIYTFDPRKIDQGQNPIKISGKKPDWEKYDEFLMKETRYRSIKKINPEHADFLLEQNKKDAQYRFRQLKRMAAADYSDEIEE